MTVHHAGVLSVDYFLAYAQLVMQSKELSIEHTDKFVDQYFFKGNPYIYGKQTRQNFEKAIEYLKNDGID